MPTEIKELNHGPSIEVVDSAYMPTFLIDDDDKLEIPNFVTDDEKETNQKSTVKKVKQQVIEDNEDDKEDDEKQFFQIDEGEDEEDEEEDDSVVDKKTKDNNTNEDDNDDTNEEEYDEDDEEKVDVIKRHIEVLKSLGLTDLPDDYEFDGDIEDFYKKDYNAKVNAIYNHIVSNAAPEAHDLIEYVMSGGKDLKSVFNKKEEMGLLVSETDLDDTEEAEKFIRQHLKRKGNKDRTIDKLIQSYLDDETLEETAKEFYEEARQEFTELQERRKNEEREKELLTQKQQKEFYNNLTANLKQTGWKPEKQQEVLKMLSKDKTGQVPIQSKLASIFSNPQVLVVFADLLSSYDEANGKWNLEETNVGSSIKSNTQSKLKNSIEDIFSSSKKTSGKNTSSNKKIITTKDWKISTD